jgi:hypothetical protein
VSWEEYERRVRGYLRDDGFDEYCVQHGDAENADIGAYQAILDAATNESPLQQYLAQNPKLLIGEMGGHCRWVIPWRRLGSEFVPDFIIARMDSTGLNWTLVELQSPTVSLFNRDRRPSRHLQEGISQILDWRSWIAANRDYAQRRRAQNGLGLFDIDHTARGLVLMGGRTMSWIGDREQIRQLKSNLQIDIHSYDWLIREAQQRIEFRRQFPQWGTLPCGECSVG